MTEHSTVYQNSILEPLGGRSPYRAANVLTSAKNKALLVGRARELDKLLDYIFNGNSVAVVGPRRIGKSLLVHIAQDVIHGRTKRYRDRMIDPKLVRTVRAWESELKGFICVSDTLEGKKLTTDGIRAWFIRACARELSSNFGIGERLPRRDELSLVEFEDALDYLERILDEGNVRLVLIVDEFERVFSSEEADDILALFRSIIQLCPNIDFLFVGTEVISDKVKEISSPLANMLTLVYLGPIKIRDVVTLVRTPVNGLIDYDNSAIVRIADLTGRNPYFVQVLCDLLFDRNAARARSLNEPFKCSGRDIDRQLSTGLLKEFHDVVGVVLLDAHQLLSSSQQEIMVAIAFNPGISLTKLRNLLGDISTSDLDYLRNRDYIEVSEGNHCRVASEINQIWLREKVAPARGETLVETERSPSPIRRLVSLLVTGLPFLFLVAFTFWYVWMLPGFLHETTSISASLGDAVVSYPRYVGWGKSAVIQVSTMASEPITVSLQSVVPGIVIASGTPVWRESELGLWTSREIEFRYIGARNSFIEDVAFEVGLQSTRYAHFGDSQQFTLQVLPMSPSLLGQFAWGVVLFVCGFYYASRFRPLLRQWLGISPKNPGDQK